MALGGPSRVAQLPCVSGEELLSCIARAAPHLLQRPSIAPHLVTLDEEPWRLRPPLPGRSRISQGPQSTNPRAFRGPQGRDGADLAAIRFAFFAAEHRLRIHAFMHQESLIVR